MRTVLLLVTSIFGSCSSVEWVPVADGIPKKWREYDLYDGGGVFVLATGEGTAAEGFRDMESLLGALAETSGGPLSKGLVISVGEDDAPLFFAGEDPFLQLGRWHQAATGSATFRGRKSRTMPDAPKELDPNQLAKIVAFGIPRSDESLALPRSLLDSVGWVLVLPTEGCMEAVLGVMLSEAMGEKMSWWQRTLMAPFMPMVRGAAVDMVRVESMGLACDVVLADIDKPKDTKKLWAARGLEKLGWSRDKVRAKYLKDPKLREAMAKQSASKSVSGPIRREER